MGKKRLLTIDDLLAFCIEKNFTKFSSTESGYQLAVQIPATFEAEEETDDNHRGMQKVKIRMFHTGLNRNGSYVSKEAAESAMQTIADRPVLAAIHQLDDGTWDFEGHEMVVAENEDGEPEIEYIEKQVGSFSSEPAFWEHDDENDKDFVTAYAYISEEYTKAVDIIKRKGGTKNSVELSIEELSYNVKDKYLDLQKFYVSASTLLGSKSDGRQIEEGMKGSKAELVDFSVENNSLTQKMIESLDKLNTALDSFNKENSQKGGNPTMFDSLLEKYGKTVEDITFDYAELTDEELEAKFAEVFGSEPTGTEETSEPENFEITFSISHEDTRVALYGLIQAQQDADNDWYYICQVYDDHFIYESMMNGSYFGQKYSVENDEVSLNGDRYTVHAEFVTDDEFAALNEMRANYSSIKEELDKYKAEPQKMEVLESNDYSLIAEAEEFVELKKVENHFDLSIDEVKNKANEILLDYAKSQKFNLNPKSEETPKKTLIKPAVKQSRYGDLFKR